eukprot:1085131-Prorocentrum_minimum.AAC.2
MSSVYVYRGAPRAQQAVTVKLFHGSSVGSSICARKGEESNSSLHTDDADANITLRLIQSSD